MNKKYLRKLAKFCAAECQTHRFAYFQGDDAMDGDETEFVAKEFLKELNKLNANL